MKYLLDIARCSEEDDKVGERTCPLYQSQSGTQILGHAQACRGCPMDVKYVGTGYYPDENHPERNRP
jgi:hypothetical protein